MRSDHHLHAAAGAAADPRPPAAVPWGVAAPSVAERRPELVAPPGKAEPLDLRALRVLLHEGDHLTDSWEAMLARVPGRAVWGSPFDSAALIMAGRPERSAAHRSAATLRANGAMPGAESKDKERKAQTLAQLGRELRTRPLLGAAGRSGQVSIRRAQVVLPVARALEAAVRELDLELASAREIDGVRGVSPALRLRGLESGRSS